MLGLKCIEKMYFEFIKFFFFRMCLHVAAECQYWRLLGFDLPHPAAQLFLKWRKVRLLYEHVLTVVMDYNKIISGKSFFFSKLFNVENFMI